MYKFTKALALLAVVAIAGATLHGCNTFRGAGQDIQKGGQAMENAANETKSWERQQHTMVASAQRGGSISPSGVTRSSTGSSQTYLITADNGFHVTDVLVDGRSHGPLRQYTFSDVRSAHSISASFAPHSDR